MSTLIGVDLGGTNTKAVLLQDGGAVLERRSWSSRAGASPEEWVQQFAGRLADWLETPVSCLGLSVAGLVGASRRIENAPNLRHFEGFDFMGALGSRWPELAVHLENDVHCAVFGESRAGAAKGATHVVMLSLGTGVGGGAIVEGRLFRGSRGMGAEFGHTLLDCGGPICKCGLRGHVEAYLGAEAISARVGEAAADQVRGSALREAAGNEPFSAELLSRVAAAGDPLALELWDEFGSWLGLAFANLTHAFNPEICVVGGGVAAAGELLLEPTRRSLRAMRMRADSLECELRAAELGPHGAAIGAALLAREQLAGPGSG